MARKIPPVPPAHTPPGKSPEPSPVHDLPARPARTPSSERPSPGRPERVEMYPWLRLLELEVQQAEHLLERQPPRRGRGRPRNPFPRKAVHVTLTDEELATLDELSALLSSRLGRLHRGHLIAFLAFYLHSRLDTPGGVSLPSEIHSLTDLAQYLDLSRT